MSERNMFLCPVEHLEPLRTDVPNSAAEDETWKQDRLEPEICLFLKIFLYYKNSVCIYSSNVGQNVAIKFC